MRSMERRGKGGEETRERENTKESDRVSQKSVDAERKVHEKVVLGALPDTVWLLPNSV